MLISQLIATLQRAQAELGDVRVVLGTPDMPLHDVAYSEVVHGLRRTGPVLLLRVSEVSERADRAILATRE